MSKSATYKRRINNPYQSLANVFIKSIRKWLPKHCLLCEEPLNEQPLNKAPLNNDDNDEHSQAVCQSCRPYLQRARYYCQLCALPLNTASPRCGHCIKNLPHFDNTFAPFLYQKPLSDLIKAFKHHKQINIGYQLARLMAEEISIHYQQQHLRHPQLLVPVPLHWRRQWQRGFNQSMILATVLSEALNIPLLHQVKKNRSTDTQEELSRKQRLKNLRGAFTVGKSLEGASCAIIDDVMTTSATANSLTHALKQAGAGHITIWTLARTPLGDADVKR